MSEWNILSKLFIKMSKSNLKKNETDIFNLPCHQTLGNTHRHSL